MRQRMKQIRLSSLKILNDVQSDERVRFNTVARVQIWWSLDRNAPAESNRLLIFHFAKANEEEECLFLKVLFKNYSRKPLHFRCAPLPPAERMRVSLARRYTEILQNGVFWNFLVLQ